VVFTTILGYKLVLFSTWLCNGKGGASAHESKRVEEKSAGYDLLCIKGRELMWHKLGLLREEGRGSERWKGKRDERRMFERTRGGFAAIIGGPSHDNGTRYSSRLLLSGTFNATSFISFGVTVRLDLSHSYHLLPRKKNDHGK
jgi:hypothetical protein